MKIAILSDSHDHAANIDLAVKQIRDSGAEALLFCGDFCSPFSAKAIATFHGPIYIVFGNNDGDRVNIVRVMNETNQNVTIFSEADAILELDGRKIAMTHYPRYANALARTGDYDLVCFGHDHQARIEQYGDCLAVNPGCLTNRRASDVVAFALYDTANHQAILHNLDGGFLTQ